MEKTEQLELQLAKEREERLADIEKRLESSEYRLLELEAPGQAITLRDFAALMMAQTINTHDYCQGDTMTWDDVFKEAYRGADAMLRQREEEAS